MRRFVARVLALFRRSRLDRDLDDEIAAHLELAIADHLAAGASPDEARQAALRELGGVALTKERYTEARGFPGLDAIAADVRFAVRAMRRAPGFTAVAVATLALAIGANTAIFSVVNALLVRPLPYRHADRLAVIDATREVTGSAQPSRATFQLDAAAEWQRSLTTFDQLTFYADQVFQRSSPEGAENLTGATVSASFFSTLDGTIVAGRPFTAADAATPVLVISQRLANRLFNGPEGAVGARLTLNSRLYAVVGVADRGWNVPSPTTDVWEPAPFARTVSPRCCGVALLGRLKPGVTWAQADADVRDTAVRLAGRDPTDFGHRLRTRVTSLRDAQLGAGRTALFLLWAAVGVVLLVACANVLNLLIARNITRSRELTIRQALGASRRRLILQGLTESTLLASIGLVSGLAIARAATAALARADARAFPQLQDVHIDTTVLAFAMAVAVVTVVATGLLPSIHAANAAAVRTSGHAPPRRHRRLQQILCAAQLAAAVVLLVSAALLARSLAALLDTDLGVSTEHVLTASINVGLGQTHTAQQLAATMQRVVERVEQLPGVRAAGAGTSLPPNGNRIMMTLRRDGDSVDYVASAVSCTPGYFHALGMRLIEGRFFTAADDGQHPPAIIVSATTARHLFGAADPIGHTFTVPKFPYTLATAREATVVGVVSDVKYTGLDATASDQVYWPLAQVPWLSDYLAVSTAGDANVSGALRRAVASVDPAVAVTDIAPLDAVLATATAPARFRTTLIVAFALLALAIAAIGLHGMMAYSVSQRTAEIGVRAALGAARGDILSLVLGEALAIAGGGLVMGIAAAYATSRTLQTLLFGVAPGDRLTYAVASGVLLLVALAAGYTPARRATRVDPIVALRTE